MEKKSIFVFKKFIKILICLLSIVTVLGIYVYAQRPLFSGYGNTFEIATFSHSSNAKIYKVNEREYLFTFNKTGESCEITSKDVSVEEILLDFSAKLVFVEETKEQTSFFAYSDEIKYLKIINGKKVNLQISVSNERTKIGSPLIFGSF